MKLDFLNVLFSVLSLVILILPGFILAKTKLLPEGAESALSAVVLYVGQPMLMIVSFQKASYSAGIAKNMLIVFALASAIQLAMIGLVYLIIRGKEPKHNSARFASVFSNCGYMGLPFLQMLFSNSANEIFIYCGMVLASFNILNWSIGIYMITGNRKDVSVKRALLNPTVIAVAVGFLLFIIFKKPLVTLASPGSVGHNALTKFMSSIEYLANLVTPLAMTVIGIKLAGVNLKELFLDKWAYVVSALKLVLMSLLTTLTVAFLPIDIIVKYALFFLFSMPCATATALFAVRYGGDGKSASVFVLLSTVLSVATIPLMFLLFDFLCGLV